MGINQEGSNGAPDGTPEEKAAASKKPAQIPLKDKPALYGWKTTNDRGYTINEKLSGSGRKLKVIGVGAGASGINLAKAVRDDTRDVECVIYEKNEDVGGTW